MKILVLGADGYLGWPTCMHFSEAGHDVIAFDGAQKRAWEALVGVSPLYPVEPLEARVALWNSIKRGSVINVEPGDLTVASSIYHILERIRPDAIIHYAEQPSAPYSMMSRHRAVETQVNNVVGTLNLLFGMAHACPGAHLIKLGTMGEYGTPNIDIEEGFLEIEHKGRTDVLPFPKQAGSFYHLSKVCDSDNIRFACRTWDLRSTDLNQGVVYGIETNQTLYHPRLATSFHYDAIFGTVINRFVTQAAHGIPLTVYGQGEQERAFLNIRDTLRCVELALENPPKAGEYRVFNQFTETFTINQLAATVAELTGASIDHLHNPRIEAEHHYYNPTNSALRTLGLEPRILTISVLEKMLQYAEAAKGVRVETMQPTVQWRQK